MLIGQNELRKQRLDGGIVANKSSVRVGRAPFLSIRPGDGLRVQTPLAPVRNVSSFVAMKGRHARLVHVHPQHTLALGHYAHESSIPAPHRIRLGVVKRDKGERARARQLREKVMEKKQSNISHTQYQRPSRASPQEKCNPARAASRFCHRPAAASAERKPAHGSR